MSKISPGFAKAILEMAQKAQNHANEMDRQSLELQRDFTRSHLRYFGRGQLIGGVLALASIAAGTIVALHGEAAQGLRLLGR